jgi:hypothetical protein
MKITKLRTLAVQGPARQAHPHLDSRHHPAGCLLVFLETDAGIVGECCSSP